MRFPAIVLLFVLSLTRVSAQCPDPRLYDINLTRAVSDPEWVNCIDNSTDPDAFSLSFVSPDDIHNYILDFGDGSAPAMGALWPANSPIAHDYPLGRFTVTLSETRNGCTTVITGEVVNDRKAGATAIPPTIGTSGCVPHDLTFINNSTNTSIFTRFEWDWGDGTSEEQDASAVGFPISHTFERGKAGCDMVVSLYAYSMCDTTFSSYGPYDFWDIDTAVVTASATKICGGQDVVFRDQTLYNCNIKQPRKIRWDFSELGGPVTDWLPATEENRQQTYFVTGNVGDRFTVYMLDSNFCGVDPAQVTVEIIGPPQAQIEVVDPVICAGETGRFRNLSTGDADIYRWNYGDSSPEYSTGTEEEVSNQYDTPGIYQIELIASISGTELCRDTTVGSIEVLPSSVSEFTLDKTSGCSPFTVQITEGSSNAVEWHWNFGSLGYLDERQPDPLHVSQPGTYQVSLVTENSLGCGSVKTATFTVYPAVTAEAVVDSVCSGVPVKFLDNSFLSGSNSCAEGTILMEQWNDIQGNRVSDLTGNAAFPDNPSSTALLNIFEAPTNRGNNLGTRIRGFVCPPQTGNYIFWIASDDNSELWLSTDANPDNKVLIASVTGNTNSRQWTKYSSQQSAPVHLVSGRRYYIEAIHKEGAGGDHLAVGWQLPSGERERPVPGSHLSPFSQGSVINSWHWDFGDGNTSDEKEPGHLYSASGEYQVRLIASSGVCADTAFYPVVVFPPLQAVFTLSDTAGCTPLDVDIYHASSGGSIFGWEFGDGSMPVETDRRQDTLEHVFENNTESDLIYHISLFAESAEGCRDTLSRKVTVYPGPAAIFSFVPEVPKCSPVDIEFINQSSAADRYEWHFGKYDTLDLSDTRFSYGFINKSGDIRYDTVTLRAYSESGCYGVMTKVVTIFPEAEFRILAEPDTGCHPLPVSLQVEGGAVSWQWQFGDGSSSTESAPAHVFINESAKDTSFTIRFTGSSPFGCRDTTFSPVVVYPVPEALFVKDVSSGCSPLPVHFTDLSTGATESFWKFGDGHSSVSGQPGILHEYRNTGQEKADYPALLLVKNVYGCTDSASSPVTVFPEVQASFTLSDTAACSPLLTSAINNTAGADYYFWEFGDGQVSSVHSPSVTYLNNGSSDTSFAIMLTATSEFGCQGTAADTVTVYGAPEADFTPDLALGCTPLVVHFTNSSRNALYSNWNFGNGNLVSQDTEPVREQVFVNESSGAIEYAVTLEAVSESGCTDKAERKISVYPSVSAAIACTDTFGCSPLEVRFFNVSSGGSNAFWDFSDGGQSFSSSVNHSFVNYSFEKDTVYEVTLIASNSYGCSDTAIQGVRVFAVPKAEFVKDAVSGCSPLQVNFKNKSVGSVKHVWELGSDKPEENNLPSFTHVFINNTQEPVEQDILLTVFSANGCSSDFSGRITIFPQVTASYTSDPSGCTPFQVKLNYTGKGANQFSWDFGDGEVSFEQDPVHIYQNIHSEDTTFTVSLIASSPYGCSDMASSSVTVHSKPLAAFTASPAEITLPDSLIFIENTSSPGNWSYLWNFGDGKYSELKDPLRHSYNFYGTYEIKLVVSGDNCADSTIQIIKVFPTLPVADFDGEGEGCQPLSVQFVNKSLYAEEFEWNFGDGQTSDESDPKHVYTFPGTYTVTLTARGEGGEDQIVREDIVTVYPVPSAFFTVKPNDKVVKIPGNAHYFANLSEDGSFYHWDFGDGTTSSEQSPFHTYAQPGTYDVTLTVSNEYGCSDVYREEGAAIAEAGGKILVPNAFTPSGGGNLNSAGKNDTFYPLSEGVVKFHMLIFNRWGELVFESTQVNVGWDGYYRGELCKQDVYVYKIKAQFVDGETVELVGDVTLVR